MTEPICWICRERKASSHEHKFKASDLRRFFGKGKWNPGADPVHGIEDDLVPVQGPNSKRMTFGPVLCGQCNNTETQVFDRAYDLFIEWCLANKDLVVDTRHIDFADVFERTWESSQLNLFRYFTKHLGCNIARTEQHQVPNDLRDILHQDLFRTRLRITINIHEDLLVLPGLDAGLMLGNLGYVQRADANHSSYWTHIIVGWVMVRLWYNTEILDDATPWIADQKAVNVGLFRSLTDEQREDVIRRSNSDV